jgi:uncharacterized membrane protein YgcG
VLIFSATHLGGAGLAGYTADLMNSINFLKKEVGEHIVYAPMPHYFGAGCKDEQTVRAAVELSAWAADVFGQERSYLKHTFELATDLVVAAGIDGVQPEVKARYRLPTVDLRYKTWASSGLVGLPRATRPVGEKEEKDFVYSLISEVRAGMAIDLDPTPSFERGVAARVGGENGKVMLVVGGSQAAQLQAEMRREGMAADLIEIPGARFTKKEVDLMLTRVVQELRDKKVAAIVLQFMDSTVFTAITEDGDKIQPVLGDNGLHWGGDLSICDKSVLAKFLKVYKPLLEATAGHKTVMVGPMPRFVTGGCCTEPGHMPNRTQPGFLDNMVKELEEVHKQVRDFLFVENLRHVRVMNPWIGLRGASPSNIWGEDPVLVKAEMLPKLVEGVKITITKITIKRRGDNTMPEPKRNRSGAEPGRAGGSARGGGGGSGSSSGGGGSGRGGAASTSHGPHSSSRWSWTSRSYPRDGRDGGSNGGNGGGGLAGNRFSDGGGGGRRRGGWSHRN